MFPPFPEDEAAALCRSMIAALNAGRIRLVRNAPESVERAGQGIMLGAMVCADAAGRRLVLKTVSGIRCALHSSSDDAEAENEVFVPPVVAAERIDAALAENDAEIHRITDKINALKAARKKADGRFNEPDAEERALIAARAALTRTSLEKVYALYSFCCADGVLRPLRSLCTTLPPTGTGDCCAPKLLHYAFLHGYTPLSMAEVFYGSPTAQKQSNAVYAPCNERCALILPQMLGLRIVYRDESIIVVDKQSGILSVPGRGPDKQDCIVNRVRRLFPSCIAQPAVHRLDMETSGLMALAFTADAHRNLSQQFENGLVEKQYVALLNGVISGSGGKMELYFRLDVENRPHQIWDAAHGKKAITEWKNAGTETYTAPDGRCKNVSRILFTPHTGRTHQLRLASADQHGLGVPIIGDSLYGSCAPGERLMLHAKGLSFTHPATGERMRFELPEEFRQTV